MSSAQINSNGCHLLVVHALTVPSIQELHANSPTPKNVKSSPTPFGVTTSASADLVSPKLDYNAYATALKTKISATSAHISLSQSSTKDQIPASALMDSQK